MSEIISTLEPKDWVTLSGIALTFFIGLFNLFNGFHINKRTIFVNAVTSERVKWMGDLKELLAEYLSLTTYHENKKMLKGDALNDYLQRIIFLENRIKLHLNYVDIKDEKIIRHITSINKKIFELYEFEPFIKLKPEERFEALPEEQKQSYYNRVFDGKDPMVVKSLYETKNVSEISNIYREVIEEAQADFNKKFGYQGRDEWSSEINELVEKSRVYLKDEWEKVKQEAQKGKLKKRSWFDGLIKWLLNY